MKAVIFDDGGGELGPLTQLRPSFDVRTGALTTLERLVRSLGLDLIGLVVPDGLEPLSTERHRVPVNRRLEGDPAEPIIAINGRCPLPLDVFAELSVGQVAVEKHSEQMVAVKLSAADLMTLLAGDNPPLETIEIDDTVLMDRPWSWRTFRDRCIALDLELMAADPDSDVPLGALVLGDHKVTIHPKAKVFNGAVLNAEHGPIVIAAGAIIRPLAVINGPASIGPGSTVFEHSLIKPNTAIGPNCKVAGEVGGCILQGFANKAHDGHLGDSWLGEWVNLGAATTNSNLLNTYTPVRARATADSKLEDTGHTHLGCVLGDHTKTAIATRIMTGVIAGTGTMFAASDPLTGTLPAFGWHTDAGSKFWRLGKFVESSLTIMARRDVAQTQAYSRRLTVLHEQATGQSSGMAWEGKV